MKRSLLMSAALTAACVSLIVVGKVFTQGPASAGTTRVAVVNVGAVFQKYDKANLYKKEMDDMLKPFRLEAEKLKKEMIDWKKAMETPGFDKAQKERYEAGILANQRKLEDLDREARRRIGKKQEEQIVLLYKDVAGQVETYAKTNGIHLVLAYGDPAEGDHFTFPNINRKMQGMDLGCTNPMFFTAQADITMDIVNNLNNRLRTSGNGAPAGGTIVPTGLQKP